MLSDCLPAKKGLSSIQFLQGADFETLKQLRIGLFPCTVLVCGWYSLSVWLTVMFSYRTPSVHFLLSRKINVMLTRLKHIFLVSYFLVHYDVSITAYLKRHKAWSALCTSVPRTVNYNY